MIDLFMKRGSLALGVTLGFVTILVIGWIPLLGPFLAGLVAGLVARGGSRGALAGLLASVMGLLIIVVLLSFAGALLAGILGFLVFGLAGAGLATILGVAYAGGILFATLGGLVGGLLPKRGRADHAGSQVVTNYGSSIGPVNGKH